MKIVRNEYDLRLMIQDYIYVRQEGGSFMEKNNKYPKYGSTEIS